MERKKNFLFIIVMFVLCLFAQANEKVNVYNAYIKNEMGLWKKTIDEMHAKTNKTDELVLELINYQYGYIGWCMGNKKEREAEQYLSIAEQYLKMLENKKKYLPYVVAYRSAFYGFRIGLAPYKAPFIGVKSIDAAKLAMKMDNRNPYGYIQYGNIEYYMPPVFGGSKTSAINYYTQAQKLMELQGETVIKNDWNYLSLLVMIANAYEAVANYQQARMYYEKILKIESQFLWVKNELYPQLLKKIKI